MDEFLSIEDLCLSMVQDIGLHSEENVQECDGFQSVYSPFNDGWRCESEQEEEAEFRSLLEPNTNTSLAAKSGKTEHTKFASSRITSQESPIISPFPSKTSSHAQDETRGSWNRTENAKMGSVPAREKSVLERQKEGTENGRMKHINSNEECTSHGLTPQRELSRKQSNFEENFNTAATQTNAEAFQCAARFPNRKSSGPPAFCGTDRSFNRDRRNPFEREKVNNNYYSLGTEELSTSSSRAPRHSLPLGSDTKCETRKFSLPEFIRDDKRSHQNQIVVESPACGGRNIPLSTRISNCLELEFSLIKGKSASEMSRHSQYKSASQTARVDHGEPLFARHADKEQFQNGQEAFPDGTGRRRRAKERANGFDFI